MVKFVEIILFFAIVIMFVKTILFFASSGFVFGLAQIRAFPGGGRCRGKAEIDGVICT